MQLMMKQMKRRMIMRMILIKKMKKGRMMKTTMMTM